MMKEILISWLSKVLKIYLKLEKCNFKKYFSWMDKQSQLKKILTQKGYFTQLVLELGGQAVKFFKDSIFLVSAAVFQPDLKIFQKCSKLSQIMQFLNDFLKFALF